MGQIIVGMDGSECASVALRWALRESELRHWRVTAVLAWSYLDQRPASPGEPFDPTYNEDNAREALNAALQRAVGDEAAGSIERKVICDLPASALLSEAEEAELLVVGSRGLGGFKGLLLGSVSEQCLHHAPCPVAVVRDVAPDSERPPDEPERIVVGIDGSDASQRGLRWALDEGRARGAAVDAVYAWRSPIVGVGPGAVPLDSGPIEAEARSLLDAAIEAEDTSGLARPVERVVLSGSPSEVVLQAANDADLVVLGSRGVGGFTALLLGSVSHQVARHAPCPVVVVK
jgi:nucleotide-binding universal stress UspA family protein